MATCCLCGNLTDCKWGHNPEPLFNMENEKNRELRCCFVCNTSKVIPARIAFVKSGGKCGVLTNIWNEEKKYQYIESFFKDYFRERY